ncbi:phenylalanine--tRNA ligase subunit beta [Floccifex sp.]|uniref:phenylalanine--tRNA ligase subunit beta n=1 Tax=Floccifex sp. TaxID=2815810 RepID=UPI002A75870A|nr:phenylalanine--tRNA ligase subunit beta [Floccifex sp.]MDD7281869.1 phenylalanine--tRNA ligase subunit beta [Erysipelotrichaceae bacterium]MDY2958112.1 phenylalanine--tRNA ligase subunit beta [Floccifex sp.]
MKISRKWLSQYMDISDLTIEQLQEKITNAGFEVEAIEKQSQGTNLVIGYVEECTDHPDSDHLHCTKVNVGDAVLDVVCGAPNVAAGQKVIVAKPGAILPGGEIKAGSIRGQKSEGMICALFELGVDSKLLTEDQLNGIEILPEDAPVGNTDPLGYLGLDDEILDIGLTPNRSDCLASFSMALEAGAILNREVTLPEFDGASDIGTSTTLKIDSKTDRCPYFLGKIIGSVKIKESPKWMKELLMASGVHSINNVVDISNIVMLETGQPMHFYDMDAIPNHEITVADGFDEDYTALDGVTYRLQPEDCVITNQGKPIGIAGIMGGDDSKILDTTKGLIIECAHFDHVSIRNTARRLSLQTEASVRYQKGIEPLAAKKALDRAVQLLIEYADAELIEETVEYGNNPYEPKEIKCTLNDINRLLGTSYNCQQVYDIFERLHFAPVLNNEEFTVTIPSYRTDMEGKADLAEEVIRIIGFDSLPTTLPLMEMTEGKLNEKQKLKRTIRHYFASQGLQDCITYTLISTEKKDNAIMPKGDAVELAIPMSEERRWIRTSILPSLLDTVSYNQARNNKDCNVFEYSDVSYVGGQQSRVAFAISGQLQQSRWTGYSLPSDFYTAKGLIESLLDQIGIASARIAFKENTIDTKHFHPYRSAAIYIGKDCIGLCGQIHPSYEKQTNVKGVIMAELDCDLLLSIKKAKVKFTPLSKYPSVSRDLAFVIDRDMPVEKVINVMKKQGRVNKEMVIRNIEVFDVYEGEHVSENEKSVALSVLFQSDTHTLKDEEINTVFNNIIAAIVKDCNAQLRG